MGSGGFRPVRWLPGAHLQTLGARALRSRLAVPLTRERIELPDGDFVDLDHAYPETGPTGRPRVLVLHGLEGSSRSGYAIELYRALRRHGLDASGMNFRSCSGEPNRLPRFYHSGDTEDLRFVLGLLAHRAPERSLGLVGVSIGGNVALKFLGEASDHENTAVLAGAAISVPFDLSAAADYLERPGGRIYVRHLLGSLKRKLASRRGSMPDSVDVERALRATGFREFDDAATGPLHGFDGAEDYYRRSSSAGFLDAICRPTCIVQAEDDPFMPPANLPRQSLFQRPALETELTSAGGHVGFVARSSGLGWRFWAEERVARHLARHLLPGG